jgi:hypothetical protein
MFLSADEIRSVVKNVSSAIQVLDLLILVSAGWLLVPAVGIMYNFAHPYIKDEKERVLKRMGTTFSSADDSDDEEEEDEQQQLSPYELSYMKLIAQMLSQVARLSLLVYACDCFVSNSQHISCTNYCRRCSPISLFLQCRSLHLKQWTSVWTRSSGVK